MKLTQEQVDDYVSSGGMECPFCESEDIAGGDREMDYGVTTQTVVCHNCNEQWSDIYTMTGIYHKGNTITAREGE
jgi:hypothetical protein